MLTASHLHYAFVTKRLQDARLLNGFGTTMASHAEVTRAV